MRFISLFGGIGGFDLALTREGHECVWYNDFDKYAVQTYNKNFGENYEATDLRQVKAKDIPQHNLLCGGFPCQSFSIAGKRKGFEDTRGTMFFEICRIVKHHRTPLLLLENVKGLLSHNEGDTFRVILESLDELGYDCQWQVLNSKWFGVPQNRERVFIVASLRGKPRPQVFPLRENSPNFEKENKGEVENAKIAGCLKSSYYKIPADTTYVISHSPRTGNPKEGGTGMLMSKEYCFTLDRTPHFLLQWHKGEGFRCFDNISPTITCNWVSGGWKIPMVDAIRKLTPIECERLQGFPDGWTEGVSDTQRYKQLGNAVTVNVVQEIVKCF